MDNLLKNFKGRRVFITGHTGFKGSWLSKIMQMAGASVCGYSLDANGQHSNFNRLKSLSKIQTVFGDIRNYEHLIEVIQEFRPEIVFHLAAQPLVIDSYGDPQTTFSTNIMGSVNVLEACRKSTSVRSLVYVTSDKCYDNKEWTWGYREIDRLGGKDPYSASKAAAELIFASYSDSFKKEFKNVGMASVRAGNVIGGGDFSANRIVPDCISSIIEDKPILLRQPGSTRPWQHVLEPLSGYILLADRLFNNGAMYCGSWNFGPNSDDIRTVEELANQIVENYGFGKVISETVSSAVHEANLLQLNCDKAISLLGWRPSWGFKQTLQATTDWYKTVLNDGSADLITETQIQKYFGLEK